VSKEYNVKYMWKFAYFHMDILSTVSYQYHAKSMWKFGYFHKDFGKSIDPHTWIKIKMVKIS
jgi:hypothetical protein